jgi:beta-1,4-N-acetylglucosaminyltransferase
MKKKPIKVLAILGDGGHSTEMFNLIELLGPDYQYSYLMSVYDKISEVRIRYRGPVYKVEPPTVKEKTSIKMFIKSTAQELVVLLRDRPTVILSVGAGIVIPISTFGRLLGVKVIHIETGSRIYKMSSSGKVMYRLAHLFFVQWEPLKKDYPKAIFAGRLL